MKIKIENFKKLVLAHHRQAARYFPWHNAGPWGVMVSEFMLQQTQAERVIPYWENWMEKWPQPQALADAPLEELLRCWSGLGYNRRCRYLKESAVIIAKEHNGKIPETPETLRPLPGIGPYTACAIACFAYNIPAIFIETNIRSAVIHHFFPGRNDVSDSEIFPILEAALDRENPRRWYYALMDYGAFLKKTMANPGRRSIHYSRQSPFKGSFRQARGKVIRALVSAGPGSLEALRQASGLREETLYQVLDKLEKESFVAQDRGIYHINEFGV